jgi:hypothetical protein
MELDPPQDHTKVYDVAIRMLEMSTQDEVKLSADEFNQLILDEWDWSDTFFGTNARYSELAQSSLDNNTLGAG